MIEKETVKLAIARICDHLDQAAAEEYVRNLIEVKVPAAFRFTCLSNSIKENAVGEFPEFVRANYRAKDGNA